MTGDQSQPRFRAQDRLRIAALQSPPTRQTALPPETRTKDRHGRGLRSPLLHPAVPGWLTRREGFIEMVQMAVSHFVAKYPAVSSIEFGVEEVPPSDPADWEDHDRVLSRSFGRDHRRGLADRIVIYRLPILRRTAPDDLQFTVSALLAERICDVLAINPEDLMD